MTSNDVFGQVQAAFIEWSGVFKDPNYTKTRYAVSWYGAESLIQPFDLTLYELKALTDRRQFTYRLASDGSLIQIGYTFNRRGKVVSARLAFYQSPPGRNEADFYGEDGVEPQDEPLTDRVQWLRIDYVESVPARVGHTPCHLHIAGFSDLRIAVFGVPSPSQFIEFVLSHFYPVEYERKRLNSDGNFLDNSRIDSINSAVIGSGCEPSKMIRSLPHLFVPGS